MVPANQYAVLQVLDTWQIISTSSETLLRPPRAALWSSRLTIGNVHR